MADDFEALSVKELRARLKKHSLPTAGKKAELIKRLSVMPLRTEEDSTGNDEAMEEEETEDVKKPLKTKKKKASTSNEGMDEVETEVKKTKKKKTSTTKKSKKSKFAEPLEEDQELEEEEGTVAPPIDETGQTTVSAKKRAKKRTTVLVKEDMVAKEESPEVLNVSNATYDVVSPSNDRDEVVVQPSEEAVEETDVATKGTKQTPLRRPSECRRSVFKKFGIDPALFTPSSGAAGGSSASKQRLPVAAAAAATPLTARRDPATGGKKRPSGLPTPLTAKKGRKSTVAMRMDEEDTVAMQDTVDEEVLMMDEEATVTRVHSMKRGRRSSRVEMEEEKAPQTVVVIDEEEEEGEGEEVEDEEQEEREEREEEGETETRPSDFPVELWSDDEEEKGEGGEEERGDEAMEEDKREEEEGHGQAPEASVKPASGRRSSGSKAAKLPQRAPASGASTSRSAGRLLPGARFAAAHARVFAAQESIGDSEAKKEARRAALLKTTAATQRLATPKQAAAMRQPLREQSGQSGSGFEFGSTAVPKTFVFGATAVEDIQKVQKRPSGIPAPSSSLLMKKKQGGEEKKLDAKARARVLTRTPSSKNPLLLPTIPDDSPFVDRMATPKHVMSSASRAHRGAGGYTPKTGKMGAFVDTSKLSDREYQIALEAGLLPGPSKKKAPSTMKEKEKAAAEERRARARDELLNVKRKLNLA